MLDGLFPPVAIKHREHDRPLEAIRIAGRWHIEIQDRPSAVEMRLVGLALMYHEPLRQQMSQTLPEALHAVRTLQAELEADHWGDGVLVDWGQDVLDGILKLVDVALPSPIGDASLGLQSSQP